MMRLLQGDVGSGKTAVAALALAFVADAGRQGALLAPTDLLARQHAVALRRLVEPLGHGVTLLTGTLPAGGATRGARAAGRAGPAGRAARPDRAAGSSWARTPWSRRRVRFADLALAVVDEQHRFGVAQREALGAKGRSPHVLLMTATPIPRTLGQILLADLDVSDLRTLPAGRLRIRTGIRQHRRPRRGARRRSVAAAPTRSSSARSAPATGPSWSCRWSRRTRRRPPARPTRSPRPCRPQLAEAAARLGLPAEPAARIGVVHGQMKAADRDATMDLFRRGELDVLVGTTVLEVGVDVPEATVMLILDADRFGLAQLHQLRGRVGPGRGSVLLHPRLGLERRDGQGPAGGARITHRRLRAGRAGPRAAPRGRAAGPAPERPADPADRLAARQGATASARRRRAPWRSGCSTSPARCGPATTPWRRSCGTAGWPGWARARSWRRSPTWRRRHGGRRGTPEASDELRPAASSPARPGARGWRRPGEGTRPLADRVKQTLFAILEPDLRGRAGARPVRRLRRRRHRGALTRRRSSGLRGARRDGRPGHRREPDEHPPGRPRPRRLRRRARLPGRSRPPPTVPSTSSWSIRPTPTPSSWRRRWLDWPSRPAPLLSPAAWVVAKHFWRTPPPAAVGLLASVRTRRFGETALTFYRRTEPRRRRQPGEDRRLPGLVRPDHVRPPRRGRRGRPPSSTGSSFARPGQPPQGRAASSRPTTGWRSSARRSTSAARPTSPPVSTSSRSTA